MTTHEAAVGGLARILGVPPTWVEAALLLVGGLVGAWLLRQGIRFACARVATRTRTDLDDVLLGHSATPAGATLLFVAVLAAVRLVVPGPEHEPLMQRILWTGLILVWGIALTHVIGHSLNVSTRHLPRQERTRGVALLARFAKVLVGVVVLLTLLGLWDVELTPLLASAGLIGIALALAAQDTLSNFFAGLAVYLDRLYHPGDYVVLDQGSSTEIRGEIRDVGLRSTRILTRDDVLVVVPNTIIANGRVVNETGKLARYRVHIAVSVAYASDLDHVERVLDEVGTRHPLVLPDPAPCTRVRRFNDSGIDLELLVWIVDPRDRGLVVHELSKAVHARFREKGIVIPFPQRDVHLVRPDVGEPPAR